MADQSNRDLRDRDGMDEVGTDAREGTHIGFGGGAGNDSGDVLPLQVHQRHDPHDPGHVDLRKEEYTADEVARIAGTSREVVMHAIYTGDLKAEREGQNVVCITHSDVVDWLRRRGPGV